MLINEFVNETNKNYMISAILKHYGVANVRMKHKSMKDHAHFEVEQGILYLSTRYKTLRPSQIKEFIITIVHETKHAMDAKKYGWRKFAQMWEYEANMITQGHRKGKKDPYDDNPHEIEAESFGQKNWKRWWEKFKKQDLF